MLKATVYSQTCSDLFLPGSMNVQFPKNMREAGKIYCVDDLKVSGGCYRYLDIYYSLGLL